MSKVTEEKIMNMLRPITKEEVKKIVFEMDVDKVQDPNEFSAGFFQTAWGIIGIYLFIQWMTHL